MCWISLTLFDKKIVIIDLIAVDNNYRNKGIGKY